MALTRSHALIFFNLIASIIWISKNFETSFAIERPLHLSFVILLGLGLSWLALQRLSPPTSTTESEEEYELPDHEKDGRYQALPSSQSLNQSRRTSLLLVILVVLRIFVLRSTIVNVQCAWNGVEVYVPVLVTLIERVRGAKDSAPSTNHNGFLLVMSTILAAAVSLSTPENSTFMCSSPGGSKWIAPSSQAAGLVLDTWILTSLGRVVRGVDSTKYTRMLTQIALSCATLLAIVTGVFLVLNPEHIKSTTMLSKNLKKDLLLGGFLGVNTIASATYLLKEYSLPGLLATITFTAVYFSTLWQQIVHNVLDQHFNFATVSLITLITIFGLILLERRQLRLNPRLATAGDSLSRALIAAGIVVVITYFSQIRGSANYTEPDANSLHGLIANARAASDQWLKQASSSTSLEEATSQYRKRYGIPPPPNFDKWYKFATDRKSKVIDDFDQINHDLQPFWGLKPALIRHMTAHILDRQWTEVAGIRITGGKAVVGAHVLDTHRWMIEGAIDMINTFAEWLPDMDLAFNINDESRVAVSHADIGILMRDSAISRGQSSGTQEFNSFSPSTSTTWQSQFMNATPPFAIDVPSEHFSESSIAPSFEQFGTNSCPPSSRGKTWRWWNRRAHCQACLEPHTTSNFVRNWTLAGSVCHQPDLSNLHGFHLSPSAFKVTKQLFPIFSQSKIPSFSDILYPSPWNYKDKVTYDQNQDMLFGEKGKSLFWRGATSEGYSVHGAWQGMQRQRFVHLLNQPPRSYSNITSVDASFVDVPQRCASPDCDHQIAALPFGKPVDFQSHWSHRFLLDMDGAGFSGRFLPFLLSRSAVYRVASFRQWFEDRLTPWVHYIPVDARGREIWRLLEYFGKKGVDDAEAIANEGRSRAEKVLRKEDMEIYMFRLLLEWGRVVDDNREEVGFVLG